MYPNHSVRGTDNYAYVSYSYGCSGVWSEDIIFSVNLDNPSKGITVVVVQVTTENNTYTISVEIKDGESYEYVTLTIGSGYCGTLKIIDAYAER